jgi:hypothetical protein
MFADLVAKLIQPGRAHDHLFADFAPNGAPPQVLRALYYKYDDALPDEFVPPQHKHFRALVQVMLAETGQNLGEIASGGLKRVYSAYAACFERVETYDFQLSLWRNDPAFRDALIAARQSVVDDLIACLASEDKRRRYYSRWRECAAAPLDIAGDSKLDLLKHMTPDDWHEIALNWRWCDGASELNWITSQRECDRATAVYLLCFGAPADVAVNHRDDCEKHAFVRTLAARLEGGFYPSAELRLALSQRTRRAFACELARARATRESPWQLPEDLLDHPGVRAHAPRYSICDGRIRYHYDYWLTHLAPGCIR